MQTTMREERGYHKCGVRPHIVWNPAATYRMGTKSEFSQRYMKKAKKNSGNRTMAWDTLIHVNP